MPYGASRKIIAALAQRDIFPAAGSYYDHMLFRRSVGWLVTDTAATRRVYQWGMVGLIPMAFLVVALPGELRTLPIIAGAALYAALLARTLRAEREWVELVVDDRGVFAGDRLLATRGEVVEAYVRPATSACRVHGVVIPARPETVEVVTRSTVLAFDVGNDPRDERALLAALGFPLQLRAASEDLERGAHAGALSRREGRA
jgi:hypothetical protein